MSQAKEERFRHDLLRLSMRKAPGIVQFFFPTFNGSDLETLSGCPERWSIGQRITTWGRWHCPVLQWRSLERERALVLGDWLVERSLTPQLAIVGPADANSKLSERRAFRRVGPRKRPAAQLALFPT